MQAVSLWILEQKPFDPTDLPLAPSLLELFKKWHSILHKPSTSSLPLTKIELEICIKIEHESKRPIYAIHGTARGYPRRIDRSILPASIESLKAEVEAILLYKGKRL